MSDLLTVAETAALAENERVIERGITTFKEVGSALGNIRDADRAPRTIRSRADAIAAGRAHARARGDRLSPTQIVRLAALIRPHPDEPRAETA